MAKKYSVSAQVNGGSTQTVDVVVKDSESIGSPGFLYRTWCALGCNAGDVMKILSMGTASTVNDPVGGWASVPFFQVITQSGGITLAFID